MDYPSMNKGFYERRALIDLGAVEVPNGSLGVLSWEEIPKDCLPIFSYKTSAPKALIAANRMQLETLRNADKDVVREVYIGEIDRIRKHSNLEYCLDMVEMDRKIGRRKKKRLLGNTQRALVRDIVENLNRSKTVEDIAAAYGTSKVNVNLMAVRLRKAPHFFRIPGAKGYNEFDVIAQQLAKERPELVQQGEKQLVTSFRHPKNYKTVAKNGH